MTETSSASAPNTSARLSPRRIFDVIILSLIAVQVAAWLTILILDMNSISVVIGSIGGNQLQMILFWTGVGCLLVLIFATEVEYARDHRGAGIILIALTAVGTVALVFVAMIAISITAYASFVHFSLTSSGETYAIETSRPWFGGGGPDVAVYRTHGPFYDRREILAEDGMGSGWSPFTDGDYEVTQKGDHVTLVYGQYPGSEKDLSMTFSATR